MAKVLRSVGMKIEIAPSGADAIEQLNDKPAIDCVLMDIMMPEMDGLETMSRIRKLKNFAAIPIIAVTAKAMPEDKEQCLGAGANDYLSKPIDTDKLLTQIRTWL